MNKSGLVTRLAIVIIFTAVAVGFITAQLFYRITYLNEQQLSQQHINQLHKTVSATASIASYVEDEELVSEVLNGLISNDIIEGVAIETEKVSISSSDYQTNKHTLAFDLFSPFEKQRKVGTLSVTPNLAYIKSKADQISFTNVIALTFEASIVTFITVTITVFAVTRPIIAITRSLHRAVPGTSERIKQPLYHQESELGTLVDDVNKLLDKTEQQLVNERKLRNEVELLENRFRMLFENTVTPIILIEKQGNILLYNEAFVTLINKLNVPLKKSYGPYIKQLFADQKLLVQTVQNAFSNGETATGEFQLLSEDKESVLWVQAVINATVSKDYKEYIQINLHDISKRKRQIALLDHKAKHDQLTQLLNRHAAEQRIQALIDRNIPFALVLMDLNEFKPVNDIYGHNAGDEILIHVSGQLIKVLSKGDILSRWGGDEFVIILPNANKQEVTKTCEGLNNRINKPYYLREYGKSIAVSGCMGITFYPQEQLTLRGLIKNADKAMYGAKERRNSRADTYLQFLDDTKSPIGSV